MSLCNVLCALQIFIPYHTELLIHTTYIILTLGAASHCAWGLCWKGSHRREQAKQGGILCANTRRGPRCRYKHYIPQNVCMSGAKLGGNEPCVRARFQHTPTSEARCVQQHAPPDSGGVAWGGAGTGAGQRWFWGRHLRASALRPFASLGSSAGFFPVPPAALGNAGVQRGATGAGGSSSDRCRCSGSDRAEAVAAAMGGMVSATGAGFWPPGRQRGLGDDNGM
jgi:hypothetical protein